MPPVLSADAIKARALALGFDVCGIAPAAAFPELAALRSWLDQGYAGEMDYLARTAEKRIDVRHVLPSARSVIVAAMVYNTARPYSTQLTTTEIGKVARYAWGDDYHVILQARLQQLVSWMRECSDEAFDAKIYVDTGPIQERIYAQYAGIGWIGKNTCVINPDLGSWLFLSEVLCSLPLPPDEPALDQCGTCTLCLEACPTAALVEPHVLDSTRCLSYLTIELKSSIPPTLRDAIGTHIYGCDVCQEVCPYNQLPALGRETAWLPRRGLDPPDLVDLWNRSDSELSSLLRGSAMKRAGVRRLRRNLAIALGNSDKRELVRGLAEDETAPADETDSRRDPIVREHLSWAIQKLSESYVETES